MLRASFLGPMFWAQIYYYLLEISFGCFAFYFVLVKCPTSKSSVSQISKSSEGQDLRTHYWKIIRFLLVWICNSAFLFCLMILYCFVTVDSPILLSICGVMIALQYCLCLHFTNCIGLMMELRISADHFSYPPTLNPKSAVSDETLSRAL